MEYSILINTCDKFEDCWNPFFKLWSIFWKDCRGHIFLNTEYKDFSYPGLNIKVVKGADIHRVPRQKRATWSQCLKWALDAIPTDLVLYMQEDYFLKDKVKNDIIEKYVSFMQEHPEIKCIHLTDQAVHSDGATKYENLNKVAYKQRYRVSCQAALWRKKELLDILRGYESAWGFEEFGSKRSTIMKHQYLVVNNVKLDKFEIIPYIFTGIIQGRWYEQTIPLFNKFGIEMDFSKRGFIADYQGKPLIKRVNYRLYKIPKIIRNNIELWRLKCAK